MKILLFLGAFFLLGTSQQPETPAPRIYKVVLYDGGSQIGSWSAKDVSEGGPWMFFTDSDSGVKMTIQGTIIVTGPDEVPDRNNEGN